MLLAWWGIDLLVALSPEGTPRLDEIRLDAPVFGFTLIISLVTGVLFGLTPALQSSRPDLNEALKEGGRGSTEGARRNRLRNVLVVTEGRSDAGADGRRRADAEELLPAEPGQSRL